MIQRQGEVHERWKRMKNLVKASAMFLLLSSFLSGQNTGRQPPVPKKPAEDYSGMYAFLQDGEFVQVTVEDAGRLTGFVSRYGDLESDRGAFLVSSSRRLSSMARNSASQLTLCMAFGMSSKARSSVEK